MGQDDVDVVRRAFEALEREGVDALLEFVAPDFVGIVPPELSAEPDSYLGREGVRRYFESFDEIVADLSFEMLSFTDAGEGWVVADFRVRGRGRESGLPVDQHAAQAIQVRDGKLARIHAHPDPDSALEALHGE